VGESPPSAQHRVTGPKRNAGRGGLAFRLFVAYLIPTLLLFVVFGLLVDRVAERALERSLGRRLIGIASAASAQLRPTAIEFLAVGDDESRTAKRLRHKLEQLKKHTRVARIFVLDRSLRNKVDTNQKVRIGDMHYHAQADRIELSKVFAGNAASSVLFAGADGRRYKTGYAPLSSDGKVIAAVGVEGSARFFDYLGRLRTTLVLAGFVVVLLIGMATLLVSRRITRPLRQLASEASRIGGGALEEPIKTAGSDEVAVLASTMNEMRSALFERDQQLQMMLSGIAHEVRNPLGGISLFAGLLRDELEDAEQLEMVQRIERELEYLKRVVNDFLAFARRMPLSLTPVDLGDVIKEVHQLCIGEAEKAGVEIEIEATKVSAKADPEQLRRVLLNVLNNAIQACAAGETISVRSLGEPRAAVIEVRDTGVGISEEVLEKIFKPFFTTREKGTGLGLALSQKIMQEHGGRLEVSSVKGKGTTVRLVLTPTNPDETSSPSWPILPA
jgi:signal transduction histidine kinase